MNITIRSSTGYRVHRIYILKYVKGDPQGIVEAEKIDKLRYSKYVKFITILNCKSRCNPSDSRLSYYS
jgi:hypothetical protein